MTSDASFSSMTSFAVYRNRMPQSEAHESQKSGVPRQVTHVNQ
jgi:hypothetical protein